jgi:hypothetical protein
VTISGAQIAPDFERREHFGAGRLALQRETSVFINCPYDSQYSEIFDAVVFTTICCGFMPRCAIESGTISQPRMSRIVEAIKNCKYSIHDLCRCQGEGDSNLARFNMPLELGMAMIQSTEIEGRTHDWSVLVPRGHPYGRFISDLAGYDPIEYDGNCETAIPVVMSWLATRPDALAVPTPQLVLAAMPQFRNERESLRASWYGNEPWADVLLKAIAIAQAANLIPSPPQ